MTLKEQLNHDLKEAMRAGDDVRKTTLRQLLAGLRQAELEKRTAAAQALRSEAGAAPTQPAPDPLVAEDEEEGVSALSATQLASLEQVALTEDEAMAVIQKEAKAHRESIAEAAKAGRADLVAANEAELSVIENYLPKQLSREEVRSLAQAAIAEAGASDLKQLGAVMKILTPRTKGLVDGRVVNEVVRELLSH